MSTGDKIANKTEAVTGKIKETVGDATNNESLEAQGRKDQASGNMKQAGEKVKDAFRSTKD